MPGTVDTKRYVCVLLSNTDLFLSVGQTRDSLSHWSRKSLHLITPFSLHVQIPTLHARLYSDFSGQYTHTHTAPAVLQPAAVSQPTCVGHRTWGQEKGGKEIEETLMFSDTLTPALGELLM